MHSLHNIKATIVEEFPILRAMRHPLREREDRRRYREEILPLIAPNVKFKDKHKGERCFILGNGPSLKEQDLSLLRDEITFTCNAANKFKQFKEICTNYHVVFDPVFYTNNNDKIDELVAELFNLESENNLPTLFIANLAKGYVESEGLSSRFDVNYIYELHDPKETELHLDISLPLIAQVTVVHHAITIAIYMGFSEIYLLGCDCDVAFAMLGAKHKLSSSVPPLHAFDHDAEYEALMKRSVPNVQFLAKDWFSYSKNLFVNYEFLRKACDKRNIKFINCTAGGILDVLPRKKFEDVIARR